MRVIAGTYRSRRLAAPSGTLTRPTSDRLRETLFNILAPPALVSLRSNLRSLGITSGFTIEDRNSGALMEHLAKLAARSPINPGPIDILFLDPPYDAADDYTATFNLLGSARGLKLLATDAIVIAEHASKTPLPRRFGGLQHTRTRRQGEGSLSFYTRAPAGPGHLLPPVSETAAG